MQIFAGWDGGGTKTAVCLVRADGTKIAEQSFGPLNLNGASLETVQESIRDAVRFMKDRVPSGVDGLVVGMAGVSNRDASTFVEISIRANGYTGPLRLVGDHEIALAGSIHGAGAILIAGTGSVLYGRDTEGKSFRCGGWGYLIDDEGSGYAIGRDILRACVQAYDGRMQKTCLQDDVLKYLGFQTIPEIITWLYAPSTGKKEIAALAPLLKPALDASDSVAQEIAEHAAQSLCALVKAGFQSASMSEGELALTGGILTVYPEIRDRLLTLLSVVMPGVHDTQGWGTAADGAAAMAMATYGADHHSAIG